MLRLAVRLVAMALVAVLLFLGVTFVQVWQASRRDGARQADAIVVFGAAQYNGEPSPVLKARLDHAVGLYERKLGRMVVVTGGRQAGDSQTEAGASAQYLQRKGVPEGAILWEPFGRNSWQQLASVAGILRGRDLHRVVLVTDPFHAERVHEMAAELGLDATVSPTRTSPISGTSELRHLVKETAAVAVGRVVGFRRAVGLRDTVQERRS